MPTQYSVKLKVCADARAFVSEALVSTTAKTASSIMAPYRPQAASTGANASAAPVTSNVSVTEAPSESAMRTL